MPTTTAAVIISDALKEILVIGESETPSATMLADGLRMLNRLLSTLSANNNFAFDQSYEIRPLNGEASFTMGPTGNIVTARPIKIETAYVVRTGISIPVRVFDNERYDDITSKALTGDDTQAIYYEGTYPNGTVYCYPVSTGCTLHMRTVNSVKQFASSSVQIDMPEGYEDGIMLSLACRMAPGYGKNLHPETKIATRRAMNAVKITNQVVPMMELPL